MTKKKYKGTKIWGYLFLSPWVIYMLLFLVYPFLIAISNSFMSFDVVDKFHIRFTGIGNWTKVVVDPLFWISIRNIVYNQIMFIVLSVLIALIAAIMLSGGKRGESIFRVVYFLPVITSITVAMMVFDYVIGGSGPIQAIMIQLGILDKPVPWTFSKHLPMPIIALFSSWKWFGTTMIIFIGGIASIDQSVYEAAAIDGAKKMAIFTRMTLPLLRGQFVFVMTMNIINGMQMFTEVFMKFDGYGGVYRSALTPVLYLYTTAFGEGRDIGYASTIGIFLAILIFAATVLQQKIMERGES